MKYLDFGTLDESQFEQTALDFGRRQTVCIFMNMDRVDAPAESAMRLT